MENQYVYRIGSGTNVLGRPPKFYHSRDLNKHDCRFASVYGVREEDARLIQEAGTAAGFKGIVWSQRLWIDFDNKEAAEAAQLKLKERGYDHVVYDTGNRGCHIGVLRDTLPSHTLPAEDKAWVSSNLVGADLSLYWHLHLLRLPGCIHEKTGQTKRLLYKCEGSSLRLSKVDAQVLNDEPSRTYEPTNRSSIFKHWSITSNLTESGGSRHEQLINLSIACQREGKLSYDETLWLVSEVNSGFEEPKPQDEVIRIVKWTYEEKN